ncbi:MAG: acyl-CoA dehydratase activase [Spirochaetia bacterium]
MSKSLGINIGSSSLKMVMLDNSTIEWAEAIPHEGNFRNAAQKLITKYNISPGTPCMVTGTEGRFLFNAHNLIEPVCIESALEHVEETPDAIVTLGGEDLVVYTLNKQKKIVNSFSGSKCASGTGEFFKQQLARMDMTLDQVNDIPETSKVQELSTRCSVFMKSDCTHRLNKGEATKDDIVLSLSNVMATKVLDFLARAKMQTGTVLLTGGVTKNKHLMRFLKEAHPEIRFVVPESAPYFEALGAAYLASSGGSPFPQFENLIAKERVRFERFKSLASQEDKVTYLQAPVGTAKAGRKYVLGVDGGSTTTKACLIDTETKEIVASHYGRTHGDPVAALKLCLEEIKKQIVSQIGSMDITITLAATTGSSREILGVFLETPAVYNEIIAHAEGTTFFHTDVDTIFEIGGQDAKYVYLQNKVPIDYAMNEACSAGTGSFLEESAAGDLNIKHAHEIGDIALQAEKPLKFGEHCSAFINSDIRGAIQQGASREDITAGIVTSIVSNYLNRVVGNRSIGNTIVLQGGVAKNKAVPFAFALLLNKPVLVPPSPELMGCFGVGLLALEKYTQGLLEQSDYSIDAILDTQIIYEKEFKCKACDNLCPIRVLNVNGHAYMFGGRCNKYANSRKKQKSGEEQVRNYVQERMDLMFKTYAPAKKTAGTPKLTVGIPKCFSVYSMYPLYSWYFHELGIQTELSDEIAHTGAARVESTYCFPAEISHGAVYSSWEKNPDYIFIPHYRDMPSYQEDVHANFCPITQGLPYYIRQAFTEIPRERILAPVVSFKYGKEKAKSYFREMAETLGISEEESDAAFDTAYIKQSEYFQAAAELGKQALAEAREKDQPVIAILGRPYNAFTKDANMGIPRKFTSRGHTVIPFDILPIEGEGIFPNMYWYYGQQDMKAAQLLKNEDNIYITYITNFSCAPDSFMLHYVKWMMGIKPFLILELDSHSADAGVDTRVEAFLDIIEGYKQKITDISEQTYDNGLRFVNTGDENIHIFNENTQQRIPVKNNKQVKVLISNMGDLSSQLLAETVTASGLNAQALPLSDIHSLQLARDHASGKECVPSHLVLGGALKFLASENYRKDEIYLLFVPITTGPCRTGQYYVFYENLFKDLRIDNIVVMTLSADNSYNELGPDFSKRMWWTMAIADYMKDIEYTLRTLAIDKQSAMKTYHSQWNELVMCARDDIRNCKEVLKKISKNLEQIPLQKQLSQVPRVLIVGEIFVRRDDFAVDELIESLSKRGIVPKVSGVAEWVHYLDFVRKYDLTKRAKMVNPILRPFSKPGRELVKLWIEKKWKHHVEHKVKTWLNGCGLIPETPHDMDAIMANTENHFLSHELNSEIAVSSGVAATAMEYGYSGVINIAPFACLIGRVIEGIYTPWARGRKYPVISIEVDGNLLPANLKSKLDIFMLNVLRFRANPLLHELIDRNSEDGTETPEEEKTDQNQEDSVAKTQERIH